MGGTGHRVDRPGCEPPPGLGRPEAAERMREATVVVVKQGACSQSWQNDRLLRDELEYIDCQRREANGRALLKGGVTPGLVGVHGVRWNGLSPLCPMPTPPGALRLEAERLGLEGRRLILEGESGGSTLERGAWTPLVGPPVSGVAGLSGSGPGPPPPRGAPGRGRPEGGAPGDGSGVPPPPPPGVAPAWGGGARGAPAAGASGGPLDLLGSLLERLVAAQEASSRVSAVKGEREMDGRLKLDQRLASIGGEDEVVLVDELEAFEKQMSRANVTTWKQWYRYFEQAVVGRARAWVEEQLAAGQARLLYLGAMEPGALDSAWATLYFFMRGELLKRVGVQYEEPGEMTREQWERLAFSDVVRHYEDIDEVLDKIIMSHARMYKTGNFREGDADSQRREMQDLRRKVPKGSRLREYFAVKDYEPTSFRQWVELVQQFASTLSRRTSSRGFGDKHLAHERNRRVDDGGEGDDQNGQGVTPGEAPEDGGPETGGNELWEMMRARYAAQVITAQWGRRGRGAQVRTGGAGRGRGAVGRGAASVPWCPTCQGRHLCKTCPNICAKGIRPSVSQRWIVTERRAPMWIHDVRTWCVVAGASRAG